MRAEPGPALYRLQRSRPSWKAEPLLSRSCPGKGRLLCVDRLSPPPCNSTSRSRRLDGRRAAARAPMGAPRRCRPGPRGSAGAGCPGGQRSAIRAGVARDSRLAQPAGIRREHDESPPEIDEGTGPPTNRHRQPVCGVADPPAQRRLEPDHVVAAAATRERSAPGLRQRVSPRRPARRLVEICVRRAAEAAAQGSADRARACRSGGGTRHGRSPKGRPLDEEADGTR